MLKLEIIGIRNETDIRGNRRCIAEMEITFTAEVVGTETAYEVINQILCNAAADKVHEVKMKDGE